MSNTTLKADMISHIRIIFLLSLTTAILLISIAMFIATHPLSKAERTSHASPHSCISSIRTRFIKRNDLTVMILLHRRTSETSRCRRSFSDNMNFRKRSVFVDTDKNEVTLLLSWIYCYLFTMLMKCSRCLQYNAVEVMHSVWRTHVFDVRARTSLFTVIKTFQ